MASHDFNPDKANERGGDQQFNASSRLFADSYVGPGDQRGRLSGGQSGGGDDGHHKYLDFPDPYGSNTFAQHHPWRDQVLDGAQSLATEMRKDAGHLNGQYVDIRSGISSIIKEEERDARANGGHITSAEKQHLLKEESDIENQIHKDFRADGGDHHGGHHRNWHPGNPGNPANPGDPSNPGNPANPGDPPTNPGDPTNPTQPVSDGHLLLGTAVIPHDVGASTYDQALQNFQNKVGIQQQLDMLYTNQNLGKTPDLSAMQNDVKNGVIPVLSLRTADYAQVASGKDDAFLKTVADDLKQVNGTVYLRPNWEMDGSARQQYGTPQDFVKSWQYMHDFMQKEGVTNVKWVWTPDAQAFDSKVPSWSSPAQEYYPGSKYVDFIGSDGYAGLNGAGYKSPDQIFSSGVNFAKSQGKPFFIGETGVGSSLGTADEVKYMQEMTAYLKANPDIAGMSWFSEGSNSIFASPQEEAAFVQMEKDLGGQPA